jgi:hypothetical protein
LDLQMSRTDPMTRGRGFVASIRSRSGMSSKRSDRRPNGNVSKITAAGSTASKVAMSCSDREARYASSIGVKLASRSGMKLASETRIGGNCTTFTPRGMRPPIAMPPLTSVTSNPMSASASAMRRARIRWPMPSRCWT